MENINANGGVVIILTALDDNYQQIYVLTLQQFAQLNLNNDDSDQVRELNDFLDAEIADVKKICNYGSGLKIENATTVYNYYYE